MYTEKDIIESLKLAAKEITDTQAWSGALTLAAIILHKSEDSVLEMLNSEKAGD